MHPEEGTIHAWLDGALDAEESARVEQHVAECAACASAVAEARGLVAGASRILTALDVVPSGVVPRSGSTLGGGSNAPRRPRSLWTYLHMTPARAAAAAFLIVAAGTALVMRQASEATHRGVYSTVRGPGPTATTPVVPATPLPPAPRMVDSTAAAGGAESRKGAGATAAGTAISAPVKAARPLPLPQTTASAARKDVEEKRSAALAQVVVTSNSPAASDSIVRAATVASARDRFDSALRARPKAAMNEAVATVVGGAAPAAAPSAARSLVTTRRQTNYAGCYAVAGLGDSLSGFPKLLSLDSVQVGKELMYLPPPSPLFAVSALTDAGRRRLDSAWWQPSANGVLISFGRAPLNLRGADSTLSAAGVGGRGLAMTLQRVDCPR